MRGGRVTTRFDPGVTARATVRGAEGEGRGAGAAANLHPHVGQVASRRQPLVEGYDQDSQQGEVACRDLNAIIAHLIHQITLANNLDLKGAAGSGVRVFACQGAACVHVHTSGRLKGRGKTTGRAQG
jgi:hypothetical protein